jgi:hypothetical protein
VPTPREAQQWYASRADGEDVARGCGWSRCADAIGCVAVLPCFVLWVNAVISFARFGIGLQLVADGGARCKSAASVCVVLRATTILIPSRGIESM